MEGDYIKMWDDFAVKGAKKYLGNKYSADNIVGLTGLAREHEIMRHLALKGGHRLLDVGCASGRQVFMAAPFCEETVGVDVGAPFIEMAKKYAAENEVANVEFLRTDGGKLPFPDGSFDRLICSEVIEHVSDERVFISDLRRVLEPGGIAVFTVPNWNSRGTLWRRLLNGFRPFKFEPLQTFSNEEIKNHGDAHLRQFSLPEFIALAESVGFKILYAGGASFIDGPKIGPILERTNRFKLMQKLSFGLEKLLARIPFFRRLGRQIVLQVRKPGGSMD